MNDPSPPKSQTSASSEDSAIVQARIARQERIETRRNPMPRVDYLCRLTGAVRDIEIELRYVPDKALLDETAYSAYLNALEGFEGVESLAAMLIDDLNNELVPRFVQVRIAQDSHAVLMEDRRPRWDNRELLSRLPRF